jgi:hypothetical protein
MRTIKVRPYHGGVVSGTIELGTVIAFLIAKYSDEIGLMGVFRR